MAKQRHSSIIEIGGEINRSLKRAFSSTTSQVRETSGEFRKLQKRQKKLNRQLSGDKWNLSLQDEIREVNRDLLKTEKRLKRINKLRSAKRKNFQMRGAAQSGMTGAAAVAAAMFFPVKEAAVFEQKMARVGAVSGATGKQVEALTQQARDLGASTVFSADQAAEGMQFLSMAGFKVNETMTAMPGVLDLASAAQTDLGTTSDIASNVLSGFRLEANEMGRVGDVLTNTFTKSNTDLTELGEAMKMVAPEAADMGVSLEETAAMVGLLGNVGIKGTMAGTSLRRMLAGLKDDSGPAAEALKSVGVATRDAEGDLRSLPTIMRELQESTKGMGTADRGALLTDIFGQRAAGSASALMRNIADTGEEGFGALLDQIEKSGTAAQVASEQNDTSMGKFKILMSQVKDLGIAIGNVLIPPLLKIGKTLGDIIKPLSEWIQQNQGLSKTIGAVVVGATALAGGLSAVGYAGTFLFGGIIKLLPAFRGVITVVRLLGTTLLTNPVGLIATGIAVAAFLIWKNWDKLGPFFAKLWEGIKRWFAVGWEFIKTIFSYSPLGLVIKAYGAVFNWFRDKFEWFDELVKTVVGGVLDAFNSVKNAIGGLFKSGSKAEKRAKKKGKSGKEILEEQGASIPKMPKGPSAKSMDVGSEGFSMPSMRKSPQVTDKRTQTFHIKIMQRDGEDAEGLADRVIKILQERQGDGSELYDTAGAYG